MTTSDTETTAVPTPSAPEDDPFYFGWRYVTRVHREDGEEWEETVVVPLTYDDMLHPEEGDTVTHTPLHHRICAYLVAVIEAWALSQPGVVVLPDVRIEWDVPGLQAHGPDVAVVFGVRERQNWGTFSVAEEGTRPALIIEVTSPKTRGGDLADKLEEYEIADVPFYVIIDAALRRQPGQLRLFGYHKVGTKYVGMSPNEQGRLWLEPLRMWLGVAEDNVVLYDEHGTAFEDYASLAEARAEAEEHARAETSRADAEARARAEAEARLRELEAQLRQLRGEQS